MKMQKKCLLTGATGGIGKAIAEVLSDAGYSLILQGRNIEKLESLNASLSREHEILCANLEDENQRFDLLTQLTSRSDINLLINNAGTSSFGLFEHQTPKNIDALITLNLTVPMQITQAILAQIETNKGTVINIGSAFGSIGFPCFSSYCASKFGLRGFSESLARELSNRDVSVGYFAPRTTATSINSVEVNAMNTALGNTTDSPEFVAQQLLIFINKKKRRMVIGWPEKLFTRINGILPELVDKAIQKKLAVINQYSTLPHP